MPLCPKSVLITGANRGIGLEFVRQFVRLPTPPTFVFATCRSPGTAKDLQELSKENKTIVPLELDVSDGDSITRCAVAVSNAVGENGLNVLVNNAGLNVRDTGLHSVTPDDMMDMYRVNTIGPLLVTRAALNMIYSLLSIELKGEGVFLAGIHPGWVKTDMGGPGADLGIEESVSSMMSLFEKFEGAELYGQYLTWDGRDLPW